MFCNQCGTKMADGAMFCPKCGAKQDPLVNAASAVQSTAAAPATPSAIPVSAAAPAVPPVSAVPAAVPGAIPKQKPQKGFPFKVVAPLAGIVVLAVVAIVIILSITGRGIKADRYEKEAVIGWDWKDSDICFFNLQGDTYLLEDVDFWNFDEVVSADMSVMAYTLWQEKSDTYDLYYITKDLEPVLVEEDVYYYSVKVSAGGDYIAYLTDVKENSSGDLYLYSVKDGKSTLIDSEVYPYMLCMSPGGNAIAYLREYESNTDNVLYIGGIKIDSKKVDKDGATPIAIRDNGKEMYYVTSNDKLYLYNGKDSVKLASDVDKEFYFNRDASQMLYIKGGKTYFYELKMKEPVKVASAEIYDIVVTGDIVTYMGNNYYTWFVGLDTLKGRVINMDSGLYWLNNDGTDAVKIPHGDTYSYQIAADGKSILYQDGRTLYKISKFGEEMEPKIVYNDEYADYFAASADLSKVYVVFDDELHYVKGEKKTERITNDLSEYSVVAYNESMNKVFFIERDTLYCAGTTAKSKTEVADDVDYIVWFLGGVAYTVTNGDETTYYYMDNKEPIELYTY